MSGPAIYSDIEAAMRRGDMPAAVALARRALADGLRHPLLFGLRAHWHESDGRLGEACFDLEQGLALSPGDLPLLSALGRCLNAAGRYRAAASVYEAALTAAPAEAGVHYGLGFAREQQGALNDAWDAYAKACELDPRLDEPLARLAGLAARRGEHAAAHALADRALALNPRSVTAAFAHIVSDLAEGKFAQAEARARAVAMAPDVVPQARAHALSFAGDALDGLGLADRAFADYAGANDGLNALFGGLFEGKETGLPMATRLIADFEAVPTGAWRTRPAAEDGDGDLAFLLGFARSGTTLLGQILASHPRVVTLEEKPLLQEALTEFVDRPGGMARLAALTEDDARRLRDAFWRAVRAQGTEPRGKLVVDQTPFNSLHLPVIAALFPQAKIIFAVRDPRDVVLSCFRRLFAMNPFVYEFLSLERSARFYDATMRLAALARGRLALPLLEVRNEDVVADFDGQIGRLCDFLGLAWDDALRDFARGARTRRIVTPSAMQLTRGIEPGVVGHWRAYAGALAPIMPVVAPWVERFGYAQET